MMFMRDFKFSQDELAKIKSSRQMRRYISELGEQVADRANARARKLFTDEGGGGVGSITSELDQDDDGIFARIGYPPQFWYMNLHELGTEHEPPRPHLRPALRWVRKQTGGKGSALRSVRQSKAAQRQSSRSRAASRARRGIN